MQGMLGCQDNEIDNDMHWSLNYTEKGDYFGSNHPTFYLPPKYTPEINLIPGSHTEFRPFGSLQKHKIENRTPSVKTKTPRKLIENKANITLNDLDLPLKKDFNRKIVKLNRRSPTKSKSISNPLKVITVIKPPVEEEKLYDTNGTNGRDSEEKPQMKIEPNLLEETESKKDYNLSMDDSCDHLDSDIERNTGCKSQDINTKRKYDILSGNNKNNDVKSL
jgi:hypothetical protein